MVPRSSYPRYSYATGSSRKEATSLVACGQRSRPHGGALHHTTKDPDEDSSGAVARVFAVGLEAPSATADGTYLYNDGRITTITPEQITRNEGPLASVHGSPDRHTLRSPHSSTVQKGAWAKMTTVQRFIWGAGASL